MQLSLLDRALWAAGFLGNAAVLLVLFFRGRWKQFPVFTALVGFEIVVFDIVLYFVYRFCSSGIYAGAYWSSSILDLVLQLALVFEIARNVLKPTGTWVQDARRLFIIVGLAGAVVAVLVVWLVNPTVPHTLGSWISRANLFSIMLTCELFLAMRLASTQLGLVWRNYVMSLGQGFAAWAVVALLVEAAHSYFGQTWHYDALEHIRLVAYDLAAVYWAIIFWLPEPESRTLSPDMQNYLRSLHQQTQFGLRAVSGPRNHNT
ncbi:hypothetical protein [Paracidobacterium acidisoli]|uniref:Uncharacterized protein n=1 Tax=Paracidobacterium acidisoli TaxID=2303751 RepID=A0A372IUM3_9BACT|nr:hypothetical protein [Paracidobacterium acidisoli]MBT9329968.1 hypothetical protein [Paracidobacterium acidisoli]